MSPAMVQQWSMYPTQAPVHFIGAGLSEPHTSVTALRIRVCMLVGLFGPTTSTVTVNSSCTQTQTLFMATCRDNE